MSRYTIEVEVISMPLTNHDDKVATDPEICYLLANMIHSNPRIFEGHTVTVVTKSVKKQA
jgi:hypothetical protein